MRGSSLHALFWTFSYFYQKTIDCGTLTNNDTTVNPNIQNMKDIISIDGIVMRTSDNYIPLPSTEPSDNSWAISMVYENSNIKIKRTSVWGNAMSSSHAYVTIRYTKTS